MNALGIVEHSSDTLIALLKDLAFDKRIKKATQIRMKRSKLPSDAHITYFVKETSLE